MNLYALTVSKFPTTNIYNEIALLYEYTTSQAVWISVLFGP